MKRSVVNSSGIIELKHKRRKVLKNKIIIYFILLLILIVGISYLSKIKEININQINVSGNLIIDSSSVKEIVENNLNNNYFFIFPKTNFLIYPKQKIIEELLYKYKRIKDISINRTNSKSIEVVIGEYEGKYLYCGNKIEDIEENLPEKCYFTDSNGYIFDESPYFSGEIYFKFYGMVNENILGNYYYKENFLNLIKLKNSIEEINLKPSYILINNDNEINIGLSTLGIAEINPTIIIKLNSDYEKISENLKTAVINEPLKSKLIYDYKQLKYIDLKFGNKVYYKFE